MSHQANPTIYRKELLLFVLRAQAGEDAISVPKTIAPRQNPRSVAIVGKI
jgi:hypothetical protein